MSKMSVDDLEELSQQAFYEIVELAGRKGIKDKALLLMYLGMVVGVLSTYASSISNTSEEGEGEIN